MRPILVRLDPSIGPIRQFRNMLSTVPSILATAAMVLHSVLGCCSHHAHACDAERHDHPEATLSHCQHDLNLPAHGVASRNAAEPIPADGHHQACDQGECQFTTVGRAQVPATDSAGAAAQRVRTSVAAPCDSQPRRGTPWRLAGTEKTPQGAALRAIVQVWRV